MHDCKSVGASGCNTEFSTAYVHPSLVIAGGEAHCGDAVTAGVWLHLLHGPFHPGPLVLSRRVGPHLLSASKRAQCHSYTGNSLL